MLSLVSEQSLCFVKNAPDHKKDLFRVICIHQWLMGAFNFLTA